MMKYRIFPKLSLEFYLALFLIGFKSHSVNQQSISKIEPITTYKESRACKYSFNVSCGNQSQSFENLNIVSNGNSTIGWPWVVSIYANKNSSVTFYCSGLIISDQRILTNAKCIDPFVLSQLQVVVGSKTISIPLSNSNNTFGVTTKLVHPKYNSSNLDNASYNLVLLNLSSRIRFSPNIFPICLPISASDFPNILNQTVFTTSFIE